MRVLVVEDDCDLLSKLCRFLERERCILVGEKGGEDGEQYGATNSEDGERYGLEYPVDVAIVDLGLPFPGMEGLQIVRAWRAAGLMFPVLFLTARNGIQDKVEALAVGDDYLTKPFEPEELLARLRALVRREERRLGESVRCGPYELNIRKGTVSRSGHELPMTHQQYKVIEVLMRKNGAWLSRALLEAAMYSDDHERPKTNVLEATISNLRRILDQDSELHPIESRRGRGYRFRQYDIDS